MRLVLTAGFDRALHVIATAELAARAGHEIALILVVAPYQIARLRQMLRQRGRSGIWRAARRLLGAASASRGPDELEEFARAHSLRNRSLRGLARQRGFERRVVSSLHAPGALARLRAARADRVLYGGGGILRRAFLEAAGCPVLNAHSGPLPEVRGMNACEWSILLGLPLTLTIHQIDEGIDTGPVLEAIPVPVRPGDTIDRVRSRCAMLGVQGLLRAVERGAFPQRPTERPRLQSRQCYVMAGALRELVEVRLSARTEPSER